VLHDQAEFGITLDLERHAELVSEQVLQEPFMFFCREEHPLAGQKSVTWRDLREAELIMVGGQSGNRALLDYQMAKNQLRLSGLYEVEHLSTAIGLVSAGVGTAILPHSTIQAGTNPQVKRLPLVAPVIKRTVVLIRRKNASLSPATQIFYDMLIGQLQGAKRQIPAPPPRRESKARAAPR